MARREHPRYESTEWPDYEFQEYPKMVYPGADNPSDPYHRGKTKGKLRNRPLAGMIVNNEEEERQALSLPPEDEDDEENDFPGGRGIEQYPRVSAGEAIRTSSPGVSRLATPADEKAKAIDEATMLGVQVDRRWSLDKIQQAIDAHRNEVV